MFTKNAPAFKEHGLTSGLECKVAFHILASLHFAGRVVQDLMEITSPAKRSAQRMLASAAATSSRGASKLSSSTASIFILGLVDGLSSLDSSAGFSIFCTSLDRFLRLLFPRRLLFCFGCLASFLFSFRHFCMFCFLVYPGTHVWRSTCHLLISLMNLFLLFYLPLNTWEVQYELKGQVKVKEAD